MVVGAGCQSQAAGAPPPTPHEVHLTGTFENGCSPVDASAIFFDLTTPEMEGWFQISIWGGLPLESGDRLMFDVEEEMAQAAFCRATHDCQLAVQGEMIFTHVDGDFVQGQLRLELSQEGAIQGTFEAQWIDRGPVLCG